MSDESNTNRGAFRKFMDSLYVRVPELVLASVGGFGVLIFSLWLGNRDILNRLADMDDYIERDIAHMESLADCVKRPECEAVRALVHAHELRLATVETKVANHEQISRERVDRMNEIEREQRRIMTRPEARADPFTGSEGREMRTWIVELQRQIRDLKESLDKQ